jgi:hypothetical protein
MRHAVGRQWAPMQGSRPAQRAAGVAVLTVALVAGGALRAQTGDLRVRYAFQPDCFRPSLTSLCDKRRTGNRLDLGPQIAIWVESADRSRFVETLMVTNATALRGIGNRPGHWSLPSSPKFPYGKRLMALPVWAHTRGRAYQPVVMQDGPPMEFWLGFHESISSPDPYYCRPMSSPEIDVDALACPTAVFNSAKGKLSDTDPAIYYPPRNDLRMFTDRDCDVPGTGVGCPISARQYADLNDLDAVAAATPPYGQPYTGSWTVPADLADGDYALMVEVSKEFDSNAAHAYPGFTDPNLMDSGLKNNFGQPSVVFRVPFRLSRTVAVKVAADDIVGYGDWDGASGAMHPADQTISDAPGSGRGRLMSIALAGTAAIARVHLSTEIPAPVRDAGLDTPPPEAGTVDAASEIGATRPRDGAPSGCLDQTVAQVRDLIVPPDAIAAEDVLVRFTEPDGAAFAGVERYEVRVWEGPDSQPSAFASGTPAQQLLPLAAGGSLVVRITDLKGERLYTVGVRPVGRCLDGRIIYRGFTTAERKFSQLSGCFIATAAYGSAQTVGVLALRRARDAARRASPLAGAAAALYERSSPPLAELLRATPTGRALVRQVLGPIIAPLQALVPARSDPTTIQSTERSWEK